MQISVILNYSELIRGPTVTGIAWLALEVNNVTRLIVAYIVPYLDFPLILAYTLLFYSLRIPPLARRLLGLGLISRLPFYPSLGDLLRPAYNGFRLYRLSYPQPSHNDLP
ncbi:hypothetical protein L249_6601 [Ophiocordyceps polyrhachis-furcata BCC 54312]|uniref:Uncharacterized protein n=1 Tax=Ophiocordyceps polyrhachis-furcata BCC 54312 TaxID=1330021 RepID=A0A367LLJ1_9HYPO|nr:hypothetical protein L249_6601 [Ophiocordyceps polyrhachis-furcata BCC 54312]